MRIFPMIVYTRATVNSTPHTTLSTITSLRRVRLFNRRPNGTVLMIGGWRLRLVRSADRRDCPVDACTATDRGCRPDRSVR